MSEIKISELPEFNIFGNNADVLINQDGETGRIKSQTIIDTIKIKTVSEAVDQSVQQAVNQSSSIFNSTLQDLKGNSSVDDILSLKNFNPAKAQRVLVLGYYSPNDGGGGLFYWDNTSASTDNKGTVISSNLPNLNGKWIRVDSSINGSTNVKWFGAKGDGVTDDIQAIQAAIDFTYAKHLAANRNDSTSNNLVFVPGGTYVVSKSIQLRTNTRLQGTSTTAYPTPADSFAGLENIRSGSIIKASANFSDNDLDGTGAALIDCAADNAVVDGFILDGFNLPFRTWTVNLAVTNAAGKRISQNIDLPVSRAGQSLAIQNIEVPAFYLGEYKTYQLQAIGGNGTYSWSISSGSLPIGLTLNSNGLISGTPTTPGTEFVTFQVTSGTDTDRVSLGVGVVAPYILTRELYDLTVGEIVRPYKLQAGSVDASLTLTWTMKYAPEGLVLATDGTISGTITATAGNYAPEITLTDSFGNKHTRVMAVTVHAVDAEIRFTNTGDLPEFFLNEAIPLFQFRNKGGGNSYRLSINTNITPPPGYTNAAGFPTATQPFPGMTLSSAGVLSGTPTQTGRFSFYVEAESTVYPGVSWSTLLRVTVRTGGITPKIREVRLPSAYPGIAYNGVVIAENLGDGPYTYSASNLPTGLTINPSTGAITGTPPTVLTIHGVKLRWSDQIYNCQIRGFRAGSGIFISGPSNLHRVRNVLIGNCDFGINIATQCYDSHWEDGYIYGCRTGIRLGSGGAAHNFINWRIEFIARHGVDIDGGNENTFTSCYWDTCGLSGLRARNSKNLNLTGNRFYRSGRLVRGVSNPWNPNANPEFSNHIYLIGCQDTVICGNTFSLGQGGSDSSELDLNVKDNRDFLRPRTCLSYSDCPGLVVVGNSMIGSVDIPIITSDSGDLVTVENNQVLTDRTSIKSLIFRRPTPEAIIENGDFQEWYTLTSYNLAAAEDTDYSFAPNWRFERSSSTNVPMLFERREARGNNYVLPCRYYFHFEKNADTGKAPGTSQPIALKYFLKDYLWELTNRRVILSFYARSTVRNRVFSRMTFYPATAEDGFTVYQVEGFTRTISPEWQRYWTIRTLPDTRDLTLGRNGSPTLEVQFFLEDAGVPYNLDITGLMIEPAEPRFIPGKYINRVTKFDQLAVDDYYKLGNNRILYGSAPPTTGTYRQGDRMLNIAPVAGGSEGWVCVANSTNNNGGTWKAFGSIAA